MLVKRIMQANTSGMPMVVTNFINTESANFTTRLQQSANNYANGYIYSDAAYLVANSNCSHMFSGMSSLEEINMARFDFSKTTDMSYMFSGCQNLYSIFYLNTFNVSKVTDFSHMFHNCSKLSFADFSDWNVSNGKNFVNMFTNCDNLYCDLSNWNMSNAKNMHMMFLYCNTLPTLFPMNLNGCDLSWMFAYSVNKSPISFNNWNLVNCNCEDVVQGCGDLNFYNLNISNCIFTSFQTGTYASSMLNLNFNGCNINNSSFIFNTRNSQYISISNFNAINCNSINIYRMSTNLVSTDISNASFINCKINGFIDCNVMQSINIKNLNLQDCNLNTTRGIFEYTLALDSVNVMDVEANNCDFGAYSPSFSYKPGTHNFNLSNCNFSNCRFDKFFSEYKNLTTIDFSDCNFYNTYSSAYMFSNSNLASITGLNHINFAMYAYAEGMFYNCSNLMSINVIGMDSGNIGSFASMFMGCNSLTSLDFSGWNTYRGEEFSDMFPSGRNHIKIWIPINFVVSSGTSPIASARSYSKADIYFEGNSEHHNFGSGLGRNWNLHYNATYQQFLNA